MILHHWWYRSSASFSCRHRNRGSHALMRCCPSEHPRRSGKPGGIFPDSMPKWKLPSVFPYRLHFRVVSGTQTKHLPVVLQPPDAERVFLLMKVLWVFLPPGRSPGSALWSGMKRTLSGLLLESRQVLHQSVCGHGPYSRTGIRSIIPEILLFQKHVSTWHKCCFLQHISWITIVLFYNEDVTYSSHYKGGFIWEIQSYHSMNWWKQFWSN